MKKTITLIMVLALALSLLTLAGCSKKEGAGKESAEKIVEKMQAALAEKPCSQAELVTSFDFSMDAGDAGNVDLSMVNTSSVTTCQDPVAAYTKNTGEVNILGEGATTVITESYTLFENDELVTYVCTEGTWMKMANDLSIEDILESASSVTVNSANAAIDDSVTEWNGKKAICVTTKIEGNDLKDALGDVMDGLSQDMGSTGTIEVDYSALSCDARIYIDPETYLPIAEEMTINGMTEVMAPVFSSMGITVEVPACTVNAEFTSYEAQKSIELPEGAAESAIPVDQAAA